jgi:nucleotide-binding universal stress UspA family protein
MRGDTRPVVVAYDGSPPSEAALHAAVQLFGGREFLVVSVWEPGLADATAERGAEIVRGLGAQARALPAADDSDIADAVATLGEQHDAAAIVVGSQGQGGLRSAFLGSTSRRLLHDTDRPVLVVSAARP